MKKKLKGMTLVEVLVALAVFAVMSSLLAGACAWVTSIIKKTDKINKKVSIEAPMVEVKATNCVTEIPNANIGIEANGTTVTVIGDVIAATDDSHIDDDTGNLKYFKAN